jgi:hypothetical protein
MLGERMIAQLDARTRARQRARILTDGDVEADFEPIVVRHDVEDDFGTVNGQQTIAEVKDLLANWDARMAALNASVNAFSGQWQASDPNAWADFDRDMGALTARYGKASSDAKAAISDSSWNPLPASMIPAQNAFDNIMKAIRQCYPPDGCPTSKGDYDELLQRVSAAQSSAGQSTAMQSAPTIQPVAQDVDLQVLQTTQPLDVVAKITGQLAPPPPGSMLSALKWFYDHRKALIITGGLAVGGMVLWQVWSIISLPTAAAKAAIAAAA